jgi:hypothetical protein
MARPAALLVLFAACGGHGGSDDSHTDADMLVPPQGCDAQDDDGDGWSNAVEIAMGTSPSDPADNPDTRHQIVFAVPYHGAPRPSTNRVDAPARVSRADVTIVLDTSGSMLGPDTRIQAQFQALITTLSGQVDDLAFGAAGFGDFPVFDGANSQYDVPFYLVHRVMTARTPAGLSSIVGALTYKNIITSGLGPWFAGMRGGDDPEQGWEALRQVATGVGITYPNPSGGTSSVPAFAPATAYPATPPAGEESGTIGGLGFRANSMPIVMMITDTSQHSEVLSTTTPPSANREVAAQALAQIGARVIGVKTFASTGQADLASIATATGAQVSPEAWGTGADRPANCPIGSCCTVADDPEFGPTTQPLPVNGECVLVFQSDKYDTGLADIMAQAITAVARGVRFDAGASMIDDPSDTVDTTMFVEHVEAVADGTCSGGSVHDTNGDGIADTFDAVVPGSNVCFRITARVNDTVPPAADGSHKYRAVLQLTGDGLADLAPVEVWFVVPAATCDGGVIL